MSEPIDHLKEVLTLKIEALEKLSGQRFEAMDKAVAAALAAAKEAVEVAEKNAEKWRDSANEWRAAMSDKDARLMTRTEVELSIHALNEKITSLSASRDVSSGKSQGANWLWGVIIGGIALALALASFLSAHH